jgi:hypothetical protein
MYIFRDGLVVCAVLVAAVTPCVCVTQNAPRPWTSAELQEAIAGCRAAIVESAKKDYLARSHQTESQLPANFNDLMAQVAEPFLRTCDCTMSILSNEIPIEELRINSPQMQRRVQELTSKGGRCEAKGTS